MREDRAVLPHFLPCAFALLRQLFFQCGLSGQDGIDLVVKILDHDLCLEVDLIIVLCTAAVLFLLPVLAHHDERCLNGRHAREHQIEQDEGVRVERLCRQQRVDKHPQNQHAGEGKDERPAARKFGNGVRRPLAEGVFFLLTRGIFGNFAVCQQVQHFLVRHIAADILEDFSQKLTVFFHCDIILFCLRKFWRIIMTKDPAYLDLAHCSAVPCREFLFGTDTMGRDIFSMIWYGGRLSLFIGVGSTVISTLLAILFGAVSGLAPKWLDALLMRLTEILLSVPNLLLVIFLQAVIGTPSAWSIALVIGLTSWTSIAKVVRTEVRQLRASEYVIAAKRMGGSFFHILRCHLAPNFFSSILFMVVMNVRSAIIAESTLSFMGLGLPIEVVTWGSMLSLAEKALMTDAWWILLIPGAFLVVTLLCITNLGDYLHSRTSRKESNL